MHQLLSTFLDQFQSTFDPSVPYRGKSQTNWLISRVWSLSLKEWLKTHYGSIRHEFPVTNNRRLDAAVCHSKDVNLDNHSNRMDLAIEWEWDNSKVFKDFGTNDFRKLFQVSTACGVAIVQTRIDGRRGQTNQANATIDGLRKQDNDFRNQYRASAGQRDIAIIEFRRILHTPTEVRFDACFWLNGSDQPTPIGHWDYAVKRGREQRVKRSGS